MTVRGTGNKDSAFIRPLRNLLQLRPTSNVPNLAKKKFIAQVSNIASKICVDNQSKWTQNEIEGFFLSKAINFNNNKETYIKNPDIKKKIDDYNLIARKNSSEKLKSQTPENHSFAHFELKKYINDAITKLLSNGDIQHKDLDRVFYGDQFGVHDTEHETKTALVSDEPKPYQERHIFKTQSQEQTQSKQEFRTTSRQTSMFSESSGGSFIEELVYSASATTQENIENWMHRQFPNGHPKGYDGDTESKLSISEPSTKTVGDNTEQKSKAFSENSFQSSRWKLDDADKTSIYSDRPTETLAPLRAKYTKPKKVDSYSQQPNEDLAETLSQASFTTSAAWSLSDNDASILPKSSTSQSQTDDKDMDKPKQKKSRQYHDISSEDGRKLMSILSQRTQNNFKNPSS